MNAIFHIDLLQQVWLCTQPIIIWMLLEEIQLKEVLPFKNKKGVNILKNFNWVTMELQGNQEFQDKDNQLWNSGVEQSAD